MTSYEQVKFVSLVRVSWSLGGPKEPKEPREPGTGAGTGAGAGSTLVLAWDCFYNIRWAMVLMMMMMTMMMMTIPKLRSRPLSADVLSRRFFPSFLCFLNCTPYSVQRIYLQIMNTAVRRVIIPSICIREFRKEKIAYFLNSWLLQLFCYVVSPIAYFVEKQ